MWKKKLTKNFPKPKQTKNPLQAITVTQPQGYLLIPASVIYTLKQGQLEELFLLETD